VTVETDVFEEQMIVALNKMRRVMEDAGSSIDPKMRKTELAYYQKYAPRLVADPPASTFMEVGLAKPEFLVEIDVVGVVSRD
jgi:enamine deaminase RidA (YjgF/YER057c/UK114 family)